MCPCDVPCEWRWRTSCLVWRMRRWFLCAVRFSIHLSISIGGLVKAMDDYVISHVKLDWMLWSEKFPPKIVELCVPYGLMHFVIQDNEWEFSNENVTFLGCQTTFSTKTRFQSLAPLDLSSAVCCNGSTLIYVSTVSLTQPDGRANDTQVTYWDLGWWCSA